MNWQPQPYRTNGLKLGVSKSILNAAVAAGKQVALVDSRLPPIFTLRHLAHLTSTEYGLLRMIVARIVKEPYRVFKIRKRSSTRENPRFRIICAPEPALLRVQKWLAKNVLSYANSKIHDASTAYAPQSTLINAVAQHCGCRWLIKMDLVNFFESVSEISAFRAYRSLGYQPLIAFELARLSTRLGSRTTLRSHEQWRRKSHPEESIIKDYVCWQLGHLPQGAPTSPMLANIAMFQADTAIAREASDFGLVYTRYADDLTFSTSDIEFSREKAKEFVLNIYKTISKFGFSPNLSKTKIVPPRARKLVLGLLVDSPTPRLTRDFKASIRMHIYFLRDPNIGPIRHARAREFSAVTGLRNYLFGLAAFAAQIEPVYGEKIRQDLESVDWPTL